MKKRYVIQGPEDRDCDFLFCTSTQQNYCETVADALEEIQDKLDTYYDGCYSIVDFKIYEITLKEVK